MGSSPTSSNLMTGCVCGAVSDRHQAPVILSAGPIADEELKLPSGAWCSGITSASHAEGPGFKSQCVHFLEVWFGHLLGPHRCQS